MAMNFIELVSQLNKKSVSIRPLIDHTRQDQEGKNNVNRLATRSNGHHGTMHTAELHSD
jgi:hypothetical protein